MRVPNRTSNTTRRSALYRRPQTRSLSRVSTVSHQQCVSRVPHCAQRAAPERWMSARCSTGSDRPCSEGYRRTVVRSRGARCKPSAGMVCSSFSSENRPDAESSSQNVPRRRRKRAQILRSQFLGGSQPRREIRVETAKPAEALNERVWSAYALSEFLSATADSLREDPERRLVSRGGIEPPTRRLRVADGRSDLRRNRAIPMSESAADGVSRQIAATQTHPLSANLSVSANRPDIVGHRGVRCVREGWFRRLAAAYIDRPLGRGAMTSIRPQHHQPYRERSFTRAR